ncbi:MAG: NAD(P)/FAD-dependent oxidoreductase, partial [Anaerolineae bacterium]|nr:NAD(P)/FAD-dependent oxidoreductase [Anaerolineae bacterium]
MSAAKKPYCNVYPDGRSIRVYRDAEKTLAGIREHHAGDAEGWQTLRAHYHNFTEALLPIYSMPLPSFAAARQLWGAIQKHGTREVLDLGRLILSSTRELGNLYFETPEMKALFATWGMHLDYGPDVSAGAMFSLLETFTDMEA